MPTRRQVITSIPAAAAAFAKANQFVLDPSSARAPAN
jgi:hypothetical protein